MKKFFEIADRYIQKCDWKDLALLKFCLCAVGVMLGLIVPKKYKKYCLGMASVVFLITYIPLMAKFIQTALEKRNLT